MTDITVIYKHLCLYDRKFQKGILCLKTFPRITKSGTLLFLKYNRDTQRKVDRYK